MERTSNHREKVVGELRFHPNALAATRKNGRSRIPAAGANLNRKYRPSVSVVIPTLNEAQNLPLVLPYLPMEWIDEVILVDGHSTDGTVEVARQLLPSIKVILETKRGKGAAMWAGYKAASSDVVVLLDADGSHDPREIPRYVEALMQGADMVKGSRFAPGGGTTDMPRIRKLGNGAFVFLTNLLFGNAWTDLCYGYHAFWKHCLNVLDLEEASGFEIDTALYLQAVRKQLRVIEVPSFEGYRFHGVGKLRTIPDGWRVLKTIQKEWLRAVKHPVKDSYVGFRGYNPATLESIFSSPAQTSDNVVQLRPSKTSAQAHQQAQATGWERITT